MNRILNVMVVAISLVAAGAASSSAAPGQVSHYRLRGAVAEAAWAKTVGTDFVGAYVQSSDSKQGSELNVEQFHDRYDGNGRFIGSTVKHAAVTSGYSFAIDKARLDTATVDASGVPATLCRFDANWNQIGRCSQTTLDVHAAWTGEGLITRAVKNDHYRYHGFSITEHSNGTERNATATATINGVDLTRDFLFASLTTNNYGNTVVCLHTACSS
jgi:hypothetical protein